MDLQYFVENSPLIREYSLNYHFNEISSLFRNTGFRRDNEVAKEIINLGFDPNTILQEHIQNNCLTHSCYAKNKEMMRFLLDKITNLDHQDVDGDTALTLTCRMGDKEFAKLLLDRGVDINFINKRGYTPLIYTYIFDYYEMAEFLLENGAKVLYSPDDLPLKWGLCKNQKLYGDLIRKYNYKNIKPAKVKLSEEEE